MLESIQLRFLSSYSQLWMYIIEHVSILYIELLMSPSKILILTIFICRTK